MAKPKWWAQMVTYLGTKPQLIWGPNGWAQMAGGPNGYLLSYCISGAQMARPKWGPKWLPTLVLNTFSVNYYFYQCLNYPVVKTLIPLCVLSLYTYNPYHI